MGNSKSLTEPIFRKRFQFSLTHISNSAAFSCRSRQRRCRRHRRCRHCRRPVTATKNENFFHSCNFFSKKRLHVFRHHDSDDDDDDDDVRDTPQGRGRPFLFSNLDQKETRKKMKVFVCENFKLVPK